MQNKEITQLLPTMKAFPEPKDIFVPEQAWLANYFLPLLSIDLGELRPELAGTIVHMLNPIEPFEGNIGEETPEFHNEFCGENFYAFRLTEDNRYEFLADEGYFESAPIHDFELDEISKEDLDEMLQTYQDTKQRFMETGKLTQPMYDKSLSERAFLHDFGGVMDYGNWISAFESEKDLKNTHYRYEKAGVKIFYKDKPFFLVGWTAGYDWCSHGADAIIMLYEPEHRIVLFSLDWS